MKAIFSSLVCLLAMPLAFGDVFPAYPSTNLEKQEKTIPTELSGTYKLMLVAFLREQQADVDTWSKPIDALCKQFNSPGKEFLSSYEIPVLPKMDPAKELFIQGGMRLGVPNKIQREHIFSLYIDKEIFKKALDIKSENSIYIYLLGDKDSILWQTSGVYTPEKGKELLDALNKLNETKP